jgi:trk system potassium uptake protein TrkH
MSTPEKRIDRSALLRFAEMHPASLVVCSFMALILAGAICLKLPAATRAGQLSLVDALFTATSAGCVTGLVVKDTFTCFSTLGQGIILVLMQIGGLGVMTVSVVLFHVIGRSITFRQRLALQDAFAHTPHGDILHVVKTIIGFTFLAEGIGAILFYIRWVREFTPAKAAFFALFHAVSAFCDAGFALFPDNMVRFHDDLFVNLILCNLIVLGGIGFPVVYDLYIKMRQRRIRRVKLAIQTKMVLFTTLILIVGGAVMFWVLEQDHSLVGKPLVDSMIVSLFQSITCRTAGFNSVAMISLNDATLTMMLGLMFFGASPGSCGGGVKTTTLALIAAFTWCRIRRRRRVNLFAKSVPSETVNRSLSLVLMAAGLIIGVLFLMMVGDSVAGTVPIIQGEMFLDFLFETVSAFGTVGLSLGVTPLLSTWGKLLIILLMLIGRVGVLTFSYIVIGGGMVNGLEYSEENIMIG